MPGSEGFDGDTSSSGEEGKDALAELLKDSVLNGGFEAKHAVSGEAFVESF